MNGNPPIAPSHFGGFGPSRFPRIFRGLRPAYVQATLAENQRTGEQPDPGTRKGHPMQDMLQPLIHKAALRDIAVHVARAGLSIGDEAALHLLPDGRIGVFTRRSRRILGLIPRRVTLQLGVLGPQASRIILPAVENAEPLRVRIVGLTPEHLVPEGGRTEIHISVWGHPRHAVAPAAAPPLPG